MEYIRGDVVFIHSKTAHKNTHIIWDERPYLIVQNDTGNLFSGTTIVVPLTCKIKKMNMPTHIKVMWDGLKPSVIQCEQVRVIDSTECSLWEYMTHLPDEIMEAVDEALMAALGIGGRCRGY